MPTMNRCGNDLFGYCIGDPKLKTIDTTKTVYDYKGNGHEVPVSISTCQNCPSTCEHFQTFTESINPRPAPAIKA